MSEEIVIDISADGKSVTVEGKGIKGPDCVALTKEIEEALGTRLQQTKTAEFSMPRSVTRKVNA